MTAEVKKTVVAVIAIAVFAAVAGGALAEVVEAGSMTFLAGAEEVLSC
jgi:hypothetical protein